MDEISDPEPILELRGINKSFGPVHVLHDVDFHVYPGQVTALVGDNGAGKSTLVKCIAGVYASDSGEMFFEGEPVTISGPKDAAALGIEVVYQDLALCDNLDIVQNMFLGREKAKTRALDEPGMEILARRTLANLSVRTVSSARQLVASLSGGQRQTVAIAKAVLWNSKVVLLDEPTAALGVAQTRQVLDLVRRLAETGHGVVIITHNMVDVMEVADRVCALFLGRVAAEVKRTETSHQQLVELITAGRSGNIGIARAEQVQISMAVPSTEPERGGFELDEQRTSTLDALKASIWKRGDLGATPAVGGLIALTIFFGVSADRFLSATNFANLLTQATAVIILAMAVTFVLLLGEIDLSAGYTAGVCVVFMAWLMYEHGVTGWIAIPAGFIVGAAIGTFTGWLVAAVGIPAFVATLAFFLAWQGVVLQIAKEGGTIPIDNEVVLAIVNKTISPELGWVLWALVVGGYLATALLRRRGRESVGLAGEPLGAILVKGALIAVGWGIATFILNQDRAFAGALRALEGVPVAVPVVLGLIVALHFVLSRTAWGRHVYAVGGNIEAARRAGINVVWLKMSCFILCGVVACLAGMALGSQLNSVSPQTGGNDTLLRAVGAAAIGGVSLFGGKGKIIYPVIGGLVVTMIDNGLGLMGTIGPVDFTESGPKFIVQGAVLLLAASVDALSRKGGTAGS